jgi:hypothetical protein
MNARTTVDGLAGTGIRRTPRGLSFFLPLGLCATYQGE